MFVFVSFGLLDLLCKSPKSRYSVNLSVAAAAGRADKLRRPFRAYFGQLRCPKKPSEKVRVFVFVIHCERNEEKRSALSNTVHGQCAITPAKQHASGERQGEDVFWVWSCTVIQQPLSSQGAAACSLLRRRVHANVKAEVEIPIPKWCRARWLQTTHYEIPYKTNFKKIKNEFEILTGHCSNVQPSDGIVVGNRTPMRYQLRHQGSV